VLAWLSLLTWAWAAFVALADRRHRVDLRAAPPETDGPLVSVIVPARDEEGRIGPALRSLAAQTYGPLEVIVVDDESQDGTLLEARSVVSQRIRVLEGAPLPPGWVGKSWANHQGAEAARGEWLLLTDADILHAPDSLARALPLARRLGRGGLTVLCRLDSESASERVIQPAAAVFIRSFVAPGPLVRSPRSPVALAAGGYILVERALYDRIGGHRAIQREIVDDQALARRVKATGGLLVFVFGDDLVRVRMYHGLAELWRGWRKNSSAGVGSTGQALGAGLQGLVVSLVPAVALARGPRLLGAAALALQVVARAEVDAVAPSPRRYWLTLPLGGAFVSVVSLASSLDRLRGGLVWRGRRYP